MMKHLFLIVLFSCTCEVLMAQSYLQPPKFRQERLSLTSQVEYYNTNSNYTSEGGSFEKLLSGRSLNDIQTDFELRYGLGKRAAIYSNLGIGFVRSFSPNTDRDNSTLTELGVGGQYVLLLKPFFLIPEIEFAYPFNRVQLGDDKALTGEGAMYFKVGTWLAKKLWGLTHHGYIGIKWQDEGRATLLPFHLGSLKQFGGLKLGGYVRGYFPILSDQYTDNPTSRTTVTNFVNAGSLRYYSVDPSLFIAGVGLNYSFNPSIDAGLVYEQSFTGKNAANGNSIFLSLNWNIDFKKISRNFKTKKAPSKDVDSFDVEETEYDETLFESKPKAKPKPQPQKPLPSDKELLDQTEDLLDQ